jgi:RimJ/RimL family protein N-acetyltransferase
MAVMPIREREAFDAHWRRILPDERTVIRTIDVDGEAAGHVLSWEQEGRRLIGYWVGREFWGQGLATRALAELVVELSTRPLYAWVARSNVGSQRVLEKCGFTVAEERTSDVPELLYELQ